MKTLSVKQPFAYLLCANVKDIENRTWKLPEKYKGERVLIHASGDKRPDIRLRHLAGMINQPQLDEINEKLDRNWPFMKVHTSAIIGSVRFVDCVINHPSIWAEKSEPIEFDEFGFPIKYDKKIYNWVLEEPILFDKPILDIKGKVRFWESFHEPIICPECGQIQCAKVENTTPFATFIHD